MDSLGSLGNLATGPVMLTYTVNLSRRDKIDGLREFIADATAELLLLPAGVTFYPLAADIARAERELRELETE